MKHSVGIGFFDKRPADQLVKQRNGSKPLVAAEVGVRDAKHALHMLQALPIERLYLIDPYKDYDGYDEAQDYGDQMEKAKKRLQQYEDKLVWMRMLSHEAAKQLPELDYAYIDGNHAYEYVKRDMQDYWPLVKTGGVLAGHDIGFPEWPGVAKAFVEFAYDKAEYYIYGLDWIVVKQDGK